MSKKYEELVNSNVINFFWLIFTIASASLGIIALVIFILAKCNVKILSWTIGYIIMSGTNEAIIVPSMVVIIICAVIFVLCMYKNKIIKAIVK